MPDDFTITCHKDEPWALKGSLACIPQLVKLCIVMPFRVNILFINYALQYQKFDVAEDCIKMFFKKSPPANQYLCRAYLCQAQLHAPSSTKNPVSNMLVLIQMTMVGWIMLRFVGFISVP